MLPLGSCDCKPGIRTHKRCCDKVLPLSQFKLIWDLRPLIIQLLLHTPDDLTSSSSSLSRQPCVLSDDQKPEITTGKIANKQRGWDPMMMMMMMMLEMNLMIMIIIMIMMVLVKMMKVTMTMRIIIMTMLGATFQAPISIYDRL